MRTTTRNAAVKYCTVTWNLLRLNVPIGLGVYIGIYLANYLSGLR